jgi:hypothetical protein
MARRSGHRKTIARKADSSHMKTIVTGKFAAEKQAARAVDKLLRACIRGDHVRAFFLHRPGPPPRRAGGKGFQSWRTGRTAEKTLDESSATVELEVGPAAVADGVQISAYLGNLPGQARSGEGEQPVGQNRAGILIAVETSDHVSQALAENVLRQHGARAIEREPGAWQQTQQTDFHPVSLSSLLEQSDRADTGFNPQHITRH